MKRLAAVLLTLTAVTAMAYVVRPSSGSAQGDSELARMGRALYQEGCASCHGPGGEGVSGTGPGVGVRSTQGAGPPLLGVGAAAVDLYLTTGYMPLDDPRDIPERSEPEYTPEEIEAIVAHVTSLEPGGPPIPHVNPDAGDLAEGQRAFSEHCAGCHQVVAEGGVVLDGVSPELERSTPTQIAEAIRVGPYLMPEFNERQIDQQELDSIARYVAYSAEPRDEGGWGIGHIGPIPEGLVAWLVAVFVLVGVARLIGKRIES